MNKQMLKNKEGKPSLMRTGFFFALIITGACFLIIFFRVIFHTIIGKDLDWTGMGAFIGAVGVFVTPFIIGKANEKRTENGFKRSERPFPDHAGKGKTSD